MFLRARRDPGDEGSKMPIKVTLIGVPRAVVNLMSLCEGYLFVAYTSFMCKDRPCIKLFIAVFEQLRSFAVVFAIARPNVVTATWKDGILAWFSSKTDCRQAARFSR